MNALLRRLDLAWLGVGCWLWLAAPSSAQTLINIDFGAGRASPKTGGAGAVQTTNDYWNLYRHYDPKYTAGMPLVADGRLENLRLADGGEYSMTPEEMLDCLEELGVEARSKPAGLTVASAASVYCPRGTFDTEEMAGIVRDFYRRAVGQEGCSGARSTGEMTWCLVKGRADEASLMEYEARLNGVVAGHPCTVCCQYDVRRFDGRIIMNVLAVHPVMIDQHVVRPAKVGRKAGDLGDGVRRRQAQRQRHHGHGGRGDVEVDD